MTKPVKKPAKKAATRPVKKAPRPPAKRAYTSMVRDEQAATTRQRILDAAGERFEADGYARTTIAGIAERAGVVADTVYKTFGSKARVLTALIDQRLAPAAGVDNVMDRPEAQAVREAAEQRRQLHLFAHDMAGVSTRVRPMFEIMRTASAVEPEMAAVFAEMDSYRLANMRRTAEWLAARGPLRVDVDRAAEIIWTLASPDVARMLCDQRGWSQEQYGDWLEDTLAHALLAES
jgi:AcrR family transcriptional regulator